MATVDDKKVIFSMVGVSKIIPQNRKQILKDIYLSFFYGAKIGIIGLNGAGKSTLMKIIAGLEQPTSGEVVWSPGYTVGYLPQDPPLDETKTVKENVMEGVRQAYDALKEYEEINAKFGLEEYYGDPDKMDRLMRVRLRCRTSSTLQTHGTWTLSSTVLWLHCAVRRANSPLRTSLAVSAAVWHCAVCSFRSPTCSSSTSLPTTLTPRASTGWSNTCSSTRER